MKKSFRVVVLTLLTMLLMILSTGCKSTSVVVASTLPVTSAVIEQTETLPELSQEDYTIATEVVDLTEEPIESSEVIIRSTESMKRRMVALQNSAKKQNISHTEVTPENETEETSEEPTTSHIEETTEYPTTEYVPPSPQYTFTELDKYMYCQGDANVRTGPTLDSPAITALKVNSKIYVTGKCNETGWYRVVLEDQTFYISDVLLGDTEYVPTTTAAQVKSTPQVQPSSGFVYYVYSGREPSYDLELYLWNQCNEVGIGWYYKYAVAQIAQESNWNPNSTNGKDHGLCQFKGIYWENRAAAVGLPGADIWNPYHQIFVYVRFMRGILAAVGNDVNKALSYYITGSPNEWHQSYIDHVMSRYNALTSK